MIRRGDLWWADLGEPRGSGPGRRRPVLVVQSDSRNRSNIATTVVVSMTTNLRLAGMPGNVFVAAPTGGLTRDSVVNVTQVSTVDRVVLEEQMGVLPPHLLDDVDRGLRRVLSL